MKHCPNCNRDLSLDSFGICRARRDGLNLYCKSCTREKVTAYRNQVRAMKEARKELLKFSVIERKQSVIAYKPPATAVERVFEAIQMGAKTADRIGLIAKVRQEPLYDAIAELSDQGRIKIVRYGSERRYLISSEGPRYLVRSA